jgi:hypothetical protein
MPHFLRTWLIQNQLNRALAKRKAARAYLSGAALRGVSTGWRRRGEAARKVFGV